MPQPARQHGLKLALAVEKSGQEESADGFVGLAIERAISWDALKGYLDQPRHREAAVEQIAENYLHFVPVYERQEVH
jgi:hypothetical protein